MTRKDRRNLYFNLILGTMGMICLFFGMLSFISTPYGTPSILLLAIGFSFTINYIYHLEQRVGISMKLIWIRAAILIIVFSAFAMFFL